MTSVKERMQRLVKHSNRKMHCRCPPLSKFTSEDASVSEVHRQVNDYHAHTEKCLSRFSNLSRIMKKLVGTEYSDTWAAMREQVEALHEAHMQQMDEMFRWFRRHIPSTLNDHCMICLEESSQEPVVCFFCAKVVGCKSCVEQWMEYDTDATKRCLRCQRCVQLPTLQSGIMF